MPKSTFIANPAYGLTPITATSQSAPFQNTTGLNSIDVQIDVTAAPTGTSPTLTVQLQVSQDGINFQNFGSATSSITAAGHTTLSNTSVEDPWLRLSYVVGGTSPSFGGVEINVYAF